MPKKTTGKTHFIPLKNYQNISHTSKWQMLTKTFLKKH